MHDRRHVVLANRVRQRGHVCHVAFDEVAVPYGFAMARHQIVEHHHLVTGPMQSLCGVAPHVASAPGHEHPASVSGQWRNR